MCRRDEEILADATRVLDDVRGRRFGVVEVLDGRVSLDSDWNGGDALYFDLVVSDPPPGRRGWPREDVDAVDRFVAERVRPWLEDGWMHYVRLHDVTSHRAFEAAARAG